MNDVVADGNGIEVDAQLHWSARFKKKILPFST